MNKFLAGGAALLATASTAGAALLLTSTAAQAGGLDRTGLPVALLFEDGDYAELSFGLVSPSVSGTVGGGTVSSGNMAQDYNTIGLGYKTDLSDRLSVAISWEEAFGAAIDYTNTDAAYPVQGFDAELNGTAFSALLRYEINERFSVHGGLRYITMTGLIDFTSAGGGAVEYEGSSDLGYTVGASYEIPDIALRATLTYNSETSLNNAIDDEFGGLQTGGATETGDYVLPQSVALDFQTGIAENTLLLASVRWAEWTETEIVTQTSLGTIDYDNDVVTYSVGVARRFNEDLAGIARVTYEPSKGGDLSNLAPTDGQLGLTLAAVYTMDDMTVTAGVNYTQLGEGTTEGLGAEFEGNSSVGFGLRIGYSF